jgi:hypothetical protein
MAEERDPVPAASKILIGRIAQFQHTPDIPTLLLVAAAAIAAT